MENKLRKYSDDEKEKAKDLYLRGTHVKDIAAILKCPLNTVEDWRAKGGWVELKTTYDVEVIEHAKKTAKPLLSSISHLSLLAIQRALKERIQESKQIGVSEAKQIAEILSLIDKVMRLESGQSTENITHLSVTIDEIKKAIADDKFIDIVPIKEDPLK